MEDNKKRIRIVKIWEILNQESDEDHPLTTEYILNKLDEQGIPCHRKTLYEDIKVLNANGYEVMVNRAISNEYYVVDRTFDLPELQILMDAVQASRFISTKKTNEFVHKIANLAGSRKGEVLRRNVVAFNTSKCTNEKVFYTINEIALALEQKRKVSFYYFKYDSSHNKVYQRNRKKYLVNPLATVFCDDKYYLMCFDDKHGNIVHYRIDRMENLIMTEEPITETSTSLAFDVKRHKKQLFGMYVGEPKTVIFEADKELTDTLFDKFGDDLDITERDGKLVFQAEAQISPTFLAWATGFGSKLKVVAPKEVVKDIKNHLKNTLAIYED